MMRKKVIVYLVAAVMTFSYPLNVYASEEPITGQSTQEEIPQSVGEISPGDVGEMPDMIKEITVPVGKEYRTVKVIAAFSNDGEYVFSMRSPDGRETYQGEVSGEREMSCILKAPEIGDWKAVIEKKHEDSQEIGTVRITVEGTTGAAVEVSKEIKVATDIAGLKMYFKDEDFVAEWSDTTCGNVNIEVANAATMQIIGNETVQGRSYTCPVDPQINEVTVTVVPSVSAGVKGAAKTYSFKTANNPDAEVTFEDLPITNHDSIKASCRLGKDYLISAYANDREAVARKEYAAGEAEVNIPLEVGMNAVKVYIIDPDTGYMRSTSYESEKDVMAPKLSLANEYRGVSTTKESIIISGAVEGCDLLTVNSSKVAVADDGTFEHTYSLREGENVISVVASDLAGNETKYDMSVTRKIKTTPSILLPTMICLIFAAILIILSRKRGGKPKKGTRRGTSPQKGKSKSKVKAVKKENDIAEDADEIEVEDSNDEIEKESSRSASKWNFLDLAEIIMVLGVFFVIFKLVLMMATCDSSSMEPTLKVGNTVFYNRLAYVSAEPSRGDIVAFKFRENGTTTLFAKRIIGVPGDVIEFKDGYVVVNGQYCDEPYVPAETETNCTKIFEVPEGSYFMLGDNRENSYDSRYWENPYVAKADIRGKYMGQWGFSFKYDLLKPAQSAITGE